jgi:hypothetical protein
MTSEKFGRRHVLAIGASLGSWLATHGRAAAASKKLVFIHGRSQGGKDPKALKEEWIEALKIGTSAANGKLPADLAVEFPFYADELDRLTKEYETPLLSDVVTRGDGEIDEFLLFQAEVAEELRDNAQITDQQIDAEYGNNVKERGPLNWEWVQAIVKAIDKHGGGLSSKALEAFTRDVFLYVSRKPVRDVIDKIVMASLDTNPTIVVGHSLGSVVAYNALRRDKRNLDVPLFLTLGCPLGIKAVRRQLLPLGYPKHVGQWFNAFDRRDIVALNTLDKDNFDVTPDIENFDGVKNRTDNRHGIVGYLDDAVVAQKILSKF